MIDIGCGEGYGAAVLARAGAQVVGVDIAPEVVGHARRTYRSEGLSFEVMDVNHMEVPAGSFDMAVSFQVVEHLADESGYFSELARVLKPGGIALLTTPNRLTISPGSDTPINPFHLREYIPAEFRDTLTPYFDDVEIRGMFHAGWLRLNERARLVDFIGVYEMSRANPRLWAHRVLTPLVRTREFAFRTVDIDNCLDILALCSTAKPVPGE